MDPKTIDISPTISYPRRMNSLILALATATSVHDLPKGLLSAVCYVESNHRSHAINYDDGGADSLGVCQIKYKTAQHMGFKGAEGELRFDIKKNTYWAGAYLKWQLKRYNGNIGKAVAAYNAGRYIPSKVRQGPINKNYVMKVFTKWSEVNE